MEEYLDLIPENYHKRIMIHSFHELVYRYNLKGIHLTKRHKRKVVKYWFRCIWLRIKKPKALISTSCHDLSKLPKYAKKFDYVMLSPVYDTKARGGRQAGYPYGTIKRVLEEIKSNNILALGGVERSKIEDAKRLGFSGVALLGEVWHSEEKPANVFKDALDLSLGRATDNQINA
jgi:thiamine-phosphate pyrophosphorylase